jgi:hypothetical protein
MSLDPTLLHTPRTCLWLSCCCMTLVDRESEDQRCLGKGKGWVQHSLTIMFFEFVSASDGSKQHSDDAVVTFGHGLVQRDTSAQDCATDNAFRQRDSQRTSLALGHWLALQPWQQQ